ncbi:spore coat protein U domain-containing protein [Chitinilyticum aquatile]|uniref:spore coat protein U domain-containing protein n=1 Tax=Chitinilyticum aquatile TaxID=362520 RepID=UPI00048BC079|nr:spore coat protein U domain-containing protein [Chitinilyticum aquatile]
MGKNPHRLLTALLLSTAACQVLAASTTSLQMHIQVLDNCAFVTSDTLVMDFGQLQEGDRSISAQVPITCSKGTFFQVRLNDGLNPEGTKRQMAQQNGAGRLPYALVAEPSSGLSTGSDIDIRLTATVKHSDYATRPVGRYSDTVVMTVDP